MPGLVHNDYIITIIKNFEIINTLETKPMPNYKHTLIKNSLNFQKAAILRLSGGQHFRIEQIRNFILLLKYQSQNQQFQSNIKVETMQPQMNQKQKIFAQPKMAKRQLCRFYLRGLCIYKASQCHNSHGIWDLHYEPWQQGQKIIYDYSKIDKACRQMAQKVQRSYRNLYEYQTQKIFSLEELNADREKRQLIRNQMHANMFNQFMGLLQCYYPDTLFTEDFLIREFTRVGFNKTMSIIKITHICSYVCDPPGSKYFKISLHMPPYLTKQTNFILPCLSDQQNLSFYRNCYQEYVERLNQEKKKDELTEANVKKYLFGVTRLKINLLPLNLFLKSKKMSFSIFLKMITTGEQNNQENLVAEIDEKTLLSSTTKYIEDKIQNGIGWSTWNDVYKFIGQQFKVNNANITNPLKPFLIENGFLFLNFPMIQFITSQKRLQTWQCNSETQIESVCQCQFKQMHPEQEFMLELINMEFEQLPPKQSFDVFDMESLLKCAKSLLKSKILGVDLEGRLRKNGYIEMIQINTGLNTFLIDIQVILRNGDIQTFQLCKKLLRNVFCNPKILKIFHDCRHDSLVLHQIMNTCIVNIFDTSAIQTVRGQLQVYQKSKNSKQILKTISNVKTPGYNDLLKKYNAPHGINKNKEWFHELWKKGHTELFEKRPLDPEYRDYCIKDVLDILYLQERMCKGLTQNFTNWLSSHYVGQGYLYAIQQA